MSYFSAVAEALPLTSELSRTTKRKPNVQKTAALFCFRCLIRQLVGYHLNHYSTAVLCFFYVFALISNCFSWRQSWTPKPKPNTTFWQTVWFCFWCSTRLYQGSSEAPKMKQKANKLRSLDIVFGVLPRSSAVTTYNSQMIIWDGVA